MPQARPTLSSYPTQPKMDWLNRNRNTVTRDPEDTALSEMVPEEELYQAQDDIGEQGRQRGGPYYIPSRDSLKQSVMAQLRQALGMQRAKAEAAAYPEHIKGGYGLREADIKGQYDVRAAQAKANVAGDRDEMLEGGRNARAGQADQRMRDMLGMREQGLNERSAGIDEGKGRRQQLALGYQQAAQTEKGPDDRWFFQRWLGMGQSPHDKAETLRKQSMEQFATAPDAQQNEVDLPSVVQEYNDKYRGASPIQLRQALQSDFSDPQDVEEILGAIMASRGVR